MIATIILTITAIIMMFVTRSLRRSATGRAKEKRLLIATAVNILIVASYFYIISYSPLERDFYRVLLLFFVLVYFGFVEGYKVARARRTSRN